MLTNREKRFTSQSTPQHFPDLVREMPLEYLIRNFELTGRETICLLILKYLETVIPLDKVMFLPNSDLDSRPVRLDSLLADTELECRDPQHRNTPHSRNWKHQTKRIHLLNL